jgi:hypothetical protein
MSAWASVVSPVEVRVQVVPESVERYTPDVHVDNQTV